MPAGCITPGAQAPRSATPSLNVSGDGYSRSRSANAACRAAAEDQPFRLAASPVHWVRPELVVAVKYLTWTDQGLLRQVVYQGVREDKPASEVRRP
jgi:ATP-dependent DNA ligase